MLNKEQLEHVVKMQLLYEKNMDVRPYSEIIAEIPSKALTSIGLTTFIGGAMTWGSSMFVFRKFKNANDDLKQALPVLGAFGAVDFTVNFSLTKLSGKKYPERWMSVVSSSTAGAGVGYVLSGKKVKPTIAGGVFGAIYGYVRNIPLDMFGFERY